MHINLLPGLLLCWTSWRMRMDEILSWPPTLTWNKEHDASSKGAIEPLEGRKVGKREDSSNDPSKAGHGREDHESTSGIPVGWGKKQGRAYSSVVHMYNSIHCPSYMSLYVHSFYKKKKIITCLFFLVQVCEPPCWLGCYEFIIHFLKHLPQNTLILIVFETWPSDRQQIFKTNVYLSE